MITGIHISRAVYDDLKEILALQKVAFVSEAGLYNDYTIDPLVQTIDSIQADFEKYVFLKATLYDTIVGSVKGRETGEFCWIGRLIVATEFRNQGIGKRLMTAIEKEFPETKQYLLCTGHKSLKNIRLYESLGYKQMELLADERNPSVKMVKMVKENIRK